VKNSNQTKEYDVFISYARENDIFVKKLYKDLTDAGCNVWFDQEQIQPGQSFITEINKGLEKSEFIICVYSTKYFEKFWTQKEMEASLPKASENRFIPIYHEECQIPDLLKPIVYIDFRQEKDYIQKLDKLIKIMNINPQEVLIKDVKCFFKWLGFTTNDENMIVEKKICNKTIFQGLLRFNHIVDDTSEKGKYIFNISEKKDSSASQDNVFFYPDLLNDILPVNSFQKALNTEYNQWIQDRMDNKEKSYIHPDYKFDDDNERQNDVFKYIDQWLTKKDENFLILLGDLGTGKTTTSRYLAHHWSKKFNEDAFNNPAPIYIELKKEMKDQSFEEIIRNLFKDKGITDINIQNFFRLWNMGKIVMLIDAFDVVAEGADWNKQKERFNAFRPKKNQAKAILTCRTHYFKNIDEQKDMITGSDKEKGLYKQTKIKPGARLIYLQEFTWEQIEKYTQIHRKEKDTDLKNKIKSIYHLEDIAKRPLLLDLIIRTLPEMDHQKPLSSVELYEKYTNIWIERDEIENARIMDNKTKCKLMLELAWRMWNKSTEKIHHQELEEFLLNEKKESLVALSDHYNIAQILRETMTASFLNRDKDGNFSFMHKSFLEYFLAKKIYNEFNQEKFTPSFLKTYRFQKEMIFFLIQLDHEEIIVAPLQNILINNYQENISENALQILYWKARFDCNMEKQFDSEQRNVFYNKTKTLIPEKIKLQGANMKSIELNGACLEKANFSYSDLSDASLEYAHLNHSKLDNTNMTGARFDHAILQNANLCQANVKEATFNYADVTNMDHTGIQNFEDAHFESISGIDARDIGKNKFVKPVVQNLGHCNRAVSTHKHIDKKLIASGGADGLVLIYDSSEYRFLWALEGHTGVVNMVRFSYQGNFVASSSSDRTIRLWDVHTGNMIYIFKDYVAPVSCIAFSKNDQLLASTSDNQIVIWDLKTKEKIVQQMVEPMITELLFPDHETLYAKDIDDVTWQWKISDSELIHLDAPDSIEFPQSNDDWLKAQTGHQSGILSLAISPHGQFLASANMNGTIRIWDLKNGCLKLWLKGHDGIVSGLSFIDNNTLISCGNDETIRKWNMHTGESLRFWHGHNNYINDIAYSPHSQYIATASNDKTIALWDTDANLFTTLNKHTDWVRTLCFSNDGKLLASGGRDNKIIIWDLLKRKPIYEFKKHEDEITALQFTDSQEYLISASLDRTIRVWHLESQTCQKVLQGHKEGIRALSFVKNNELVSGGRDNTMRLWDIHSGECHAILENNMGQVNSICFTPNKRVLISAGDAGRIQIWDYQQRMCVLMLYAFSNDDWMLLMPDGRYQAEGKAQSYLGYTEQETLTYHKARNQKHYDNRQAVQKVIERYLGGIA
jgi:WD40 repeat protein